MPSCSETIDDFGAGDGFGKILLSEYENCGIQVLSNLL